MLEQTTTPTRYATLQITPHQVRVVKCWALGGSSMAAAEELGISEATVETHLRRLRSRIGVNRSVDILIYLLRAGLLRDLT